MQVSPNGKMSVSEYHVTAEYGPYSYLSISLHTGRTHQIRVQFAHIGHPVVGDKMYGHKDLPEGLSRQFLHASSIKLILPGTVKKRTFNAPLATDLRAFLETIDG
jgi:23S rRNA-/tRNA-specific pseudouridylate synthase